MSFSDRIANGWTLTKNSFNVLKENKQLILFPVLSGIAMMFVLGSFVAFFFTVPGSGFSKLDLHGMESYFYFLLFLYYVINYFVVVFFNMALIHCARLYFAGEEPTIRKGISFSLSRIGVIFSWALLAATVGTILKAIQDRVGFLGKIITGLIGIVWGISTFFVVPVIAYENIGPFDAVKRSASLMKQKWGESLTAGFSFFLIYLYAILIIIIPVCLVGAFINPVAAVILAVLYFLLLAAVMSAVNTIFIAAVYETVNNRPVKKFEISAIDRLFDKK